MVMLHFHLYLKFGYKKGELQPADVVFTPFQRKRLDGTIVLGRYYFVQVEEAV